MSGSRQTVQYLCRRAADGDRSALEPLFSVLWPKVSAFTRRVLRSDADGDDVAQIALCRAFERFDSLDLDRDAVTWVLGIAASECRTFRTKRLRRREVEPSDGPTDVLRGPEALAEQAELVEAAREAAGTLSAIDVETLTAIATGERPAIPAATFRKRVERALRRVRAILEERHGLE